MQYWKKDRNYRKYANADGSTRYVITVDGVEVDVSSEVYHAYARADRRERYCYEREAGLLVSLERLGEDGAWLPHLREQCVESAEDTVIREMITARMMDALALLCPKERELLDQLYFQSISAREVARASGVYHRTILYRRDKALEKLLRLING